MLDQIKTFFKEKCLIVKAVKKFKQLFEADKQLVQQSLEPAKKKRGRPKKVQDDEHANFENRIG